eukprot:CAMPEP_0114597762 /NCGR_PEP_ID=MMETSP0125-20121206/20102_1 /TAXON_ID=485358 ORGANISM="Aristerostoma sp., Strain ATCC 50986" /NCGR_SAMPLE_ID=MMETSP0125 /ASSEMBLY_ACC=CAM_ASM_000245 /LENGTH=115 /DNA_ID=CAMNT_0001802757 /DNA_START=271 /DNA_END=618 /DNA_ORIENTATION=-
MFLQIVEAVEYLHTNDIAHLDIKLENIMLGYRYKLKVIDFDLSSYKNQGPLISRGTRDFRAPELKENRVRNTKACDVYSLGIIAFCMMSGGILPFFEIDENDKDDDDVQKIFYQD